MLAFIASAALHLVDPQFAQIESAVRAELKDPDSAKFAWPNGFVDGVWRDFYGRKHAGLITCGTMNAKNGYGGYTGPEAVAAVIAPDGTISLENDDDYSDTINRGHVARQCAKMGLPVQ
jgi:hypothetical protein